MCLQSAIPQGLLNAYARPGRMAGQRIRAGARFADPGDDAAVLVHSIDW